MWILPKQIISASALDTEALISDCEEFSQLAEQSLMWRSKPSPLRTWSQRWKRESWIKHLSGRILKHSMQNHFVAWWTSCQVAIRANRLVLQENDSEKMTPDISGRFCAEQYELFAPEESSSKTSKDTSRWDCLQSSAIWKKMVTEQRGEYSVRLKSEQVTKERESLSWPTASARDWKDTPGMSKTRPDRNGLGRIDQLARAVYHNNSQQDPENRNSTGKHQERLSPNWVEQLMGVPVRWTQLPTEWTGSDYSETELSQLPQQKHGLN